MPVQTLEIGGKSYALLPTSEFMELQAAATGETGLPELPCPDAQGNVPAVAYARVSLARKLILSRRQMGLTQRDLARLAGVRVETVSRLELGKHTADPATVDKIDRVLKRPSARNKRSA